METPNRLCLSVLFFRLLESECESRSFMAFFFFSFMSYYHLHCHWLVKLKCLSEGWMWKGQCHDMQWYFALFCASKKWRLLAQVSRTSDHDSSVSRAKSFTAQDESSKNRFLEKMWFSAAYPCGRHYFSPHRMAAKNHRLSWRISFVQKKKKRCSSSFNYMFSLLSFAISWRHFARRWQTWKRCWTMNSKNFVSKSLVSM